MSEFRMTKDHLTLLSHLYWEWNDCETGAPSVNPKRPYGNSNVAGDVCELLGWKPEGSDWGPDEWSPEQEDAALDMHGETLGAIEHLVKWAVQHYPVVTE
jgi:hypothetical protein